jgi:hypothetical protein
LILLVCAVPTIAYSLMFVSVHAWVQVTMTAFIMLIVLLGLMVARSLQYPFTGEVSISPEAFTDLLKPFHQRLLEFGQSR